MEGRLRLRLAATALGASQQHLRVINVYGALLGADREAFGDEIVGALGVSPGCEGDRQLLQVEFAEESPPHRIRVAQ